MRARRNMRKILVMASAVLALALAACGGSSSNQAGGSSGSSPGGSVEFYSSFTATVNGRISAAWTKAYPNIKLNILQAVGDVLIARLDQEIKTGIKGADVAVQANQTWAEDNTKAFTPLTGSAVSQWQGTQYFNKTYAIVELQPWCIAYNSKLVKNPPTDYTDLLSPDVKGRVGMLPLESISVDSEWNYLATKFPNFLTKLAAQQPKILMLQDAVQALAAGEIAELGMMVPGTADALIKAGAPIVQVFAKSGTTYATQIVTEMANAPHPAAAKLLANFLLSPAGQTAINGDNNGVAPLGNVPSAINVGNSPLVNIHTDKFTAQDDSAFTAKWDSIFK